MAMKNNQTSKYKNFVRVGTKKDDMSEFTRLITGLNASPANEPITSLSRKDKVQFIIIALLLAALGGYLIFTA